MEICWYCVIVRHVRNQNFVTVRFRGRTINWQQPKTFFVYLFIYLFITLINGFCLRVLRDCFYHSLFSSLQSPFSRINRSLLLFVVNANVDLAFIIFRSYQSSTVSCFHSCEVASVFFLFSNLTTHLQSILGVQVSEDGWFELWLRLHKRLLTPLRICNQSINNDLNFPLDDDVDMLILTLSSDQGLLCNCK